MYAQYLSRRRPPFQPPSGVSKRLAQRPLRTRARNLGDAGGLWSALSARKLGVQFRETGSCAIGADLIARFCSALDHAGAGV